MCIIEHIGESYGYVEYDGDRCSCHIVVKFVSPMECT